jgi:predicted membrane channel-forming protein YqfA (hemolysin III family)
MQLIPFVNSLLIVCFLAVVTAMTIMMTSTGYNDKVSHTCFILMATAGFLLLARAAFKKDEEEQQPVQ